MTAPSASVRFTREEVEQIALFAARLGLEHRRVFTQNGAIRSAISRSDPKQIAIADLPDRIARSRRSYRPVRDVPISVSRDLIDRDLAKLRAAIARVTRRSCSIADAIMTAITIGDRDLLRKNINENKEM